MEIVAITSLIIGILSIFSNISLRRHCIEVEEYTVRLHKRVIEVEKRIQEVKQ